jgi:predicted cupin superfamily sugar epimerase
MSMFPIEHIAVPYGDTVSVVTEGEPQDPRSSHGAKMNAERLIEELGLVALPNEGGFYRETYRSSELMAESALPTRYTKDKNISTAIYYLLTPETFSALHRVPTDELYHFYLGDPVTMLHLLPDGTHSIVTLGNDVLNGQNVQCLVPKFVWQGSVLVEGGCFALLGTTMAPAFDFSDFVLGDRQSLISRYPACEDLIMRLTRE